MPACSSTSFTSSAAAVSRSARRRRWHRPPPARRTRARRRARQVPCAGDRQRRQGIPQGHDLGVQARTRARQGPLRGQARTSRPPVRTFATRSPLSSTRRGMFPSGCSPPGLVFGTVGPLLSVYRPAFGHLRSSDVRILSGQAALRTTPDELGLRVHGKSTSVWSIRRHWSGRSAAPDSDRRQVGPSRTTVGSLVNRHLFCHWR